MVESYKNAVKHVSYEL